MTTPPQTVFIDRDGVINRKPADGQYVNHLDQFELLDGSIEAIVRLSSAGTRVVVVTNQQGVAKGVTDPIELEAIHSWLRDQVEAAGGQISQIRVCPHFELSCDCRKPNVGLFEEARRLDRGIVFADSVVIGDSESDIKAAARIGACAIRISASPRVDCVVPVLPDLRAASELLLGGCRV